MQLIGMLDSPYVRRVAVSLHLLDIPFEHRPVSVFRQFDQFAQTNPLVKAPTLVCNDGTVLMDSSLILDHLPLLVDRPLRALVPGGVAGRQALRRIGLALAACEKSVQIVYEKQLRPADKQHAPWLARVEGQLATAYRLLEDEFTAVPERLSADTIDQAGISTAVAWAFTQLVLPGQVDPAHHPRLAAWSAAAETLPAFRSLPMA